MKFIKFEGLRQVIRVVSLPSHLRDVDPDLTDSPVSLAIQTD